MVARFSMYKFQIDLIIQNTKLQQKPGDPCHHMRTINIFRISCHSSTIFPHPTSPVSRRKQTSATDVRDHKPFQVMLSAKPLNKWGEGGTLTLPANAKNNAKKTSLSLVSWPQTSAIRYPIQQDTRLSCHPACSNRAQALWRWHF